jgi:hypothetical protein
VTLAEAVSASCVVIGVDPGMTGAIVKLAPGGVILGALRMPIVSGKKKALDMIAIRDSFLADDDGVLAIEDVHSMPGQGVSSMFKFGRGFGLLEGIAVGLGLRVVKVRPQAWQKVMLEGMPRGEHVKQSAVLRAKELFPDLPIRFKADWGMADAVLIAEYARRTLNGS